MSRKKYELLEDLRKDPLMTYLLDDTTEDRMWRLGQFLEQIGYPSDPGRLLDLILIALNSAYQFGDLGDLNASGILPIIERALELVRRKASWKGLN